MEGMVRVRLTWFLESRGLIPNFMFGFRRKLCALDCILDPVCNLDYQDGMKKNTGACYVSSFGVVRRLNKLGVTGRVQAFISGFLYNRRIRVQLGRVLSESLTFGKGLPQSSLFILLIFNLVLSSILPLPVDSPPEVHLTVFADDVCFWTSAR